MRFFSVVSTGRSDRTPLLPVVSALRNHGNYVEWCDVEALSVTDASKKVEEHIEDIHQDFFIILGDRYEALAAAVVATYHRKPIVHIHGGESTFGSFDNQIRDAITKLSHIHFTAAHEYGAKVIGLGEDPKRVFVVGAPGLDNLSDLPPRQVDRRFVVTWHPVTLCDEKVDCLRKALKKFRKYEIIWTQPNNDPSTDDGMEDVHFMSSYMAPKTYIELCRSAAAVIGNSSSGIIEAPTLGVPTVNIGRRQEGRIRGPSVIDCENNVASIVRGIQQAIAYEGTYDNPYGGPGASARIAEILTSIETKDILIKRQ